MDVDERLSSVVTIGETEAEHGIEMIDGRVVNAVKVTNAAKVTNVAKVGNPARVANPVRISFSRNATWACRIRTGRPHYIMVPRTTSNGGNESESMSLLPETRTVIAILMDTATTPLMTAAQKSMEIGSILVAASVPPPSVAAVTIA